jgi:hypothetical protein
MTRLSDQVTSARKNWETTTTEKKKLSQKRIGEIFSAVVGGLTVILCIIGFIALSIMTGGVAGVGLGIGVGIAGACGMLRPIMLALQSIGTAKATGEKLRAAKKEEVSAKERVENLMTLQDMLKMRSAEEAEQLAGEIGVIDPFSTTQIVDLEARLEENSAPSEDLSVLASRVIDANISAADGGDYFTKFVGGGDKNALANQLEGTAIGKLDALLVPSGKTIELKGKGINERFNVICKALSENYPDGWPALLQKIIQNSHLADDGRDRVDAIADSEWIPTESPLLRSVLSPICNGGNLSERKSLVVDSKSATIVNQFYSINGSAFTLASLEATLRAGDTPPTQKMKICYRRDDGVEELPLHLAPAPSDDGGGEILDA